MIKHDIKVQRRRLHLCLLLLLHCIEVVIDCNSTHFCVLDSRVSLRNERSGRNRTPSSVNSKRTVTKRMLVLLSFIALRERNPARMD